MCCREVRRLGGSQQQRRLPAARAGVLPVPPSRAAAAGGRKPRAGPRADGAARPLNGCGSGASTAPGLPLLAGAAGPARGPPSSVAVPDRAAAAAPAPRRGQLPQGRAATRPPGASAGLQRDLPGARHCRDRRLWQIPAGHHLPLGASLGVQRQLPALGESGGGLGGLRPPRCSGNRRRWEEENKQAASVWNSKRAGLFLFTY